MLVYGFVLFFMGSIVRMSNFSPPMGVSLLHRPSYLEPSLNSILSNPKRGGGGRSRCQEEEEEEEEGEVEVEVRAHRLARAGQEACCTILWQSTATASVGSIAAHAML